MNKSRNQEVNSAEGSKLSSTGADSGRVVFLLQPGSTALADRLAENFRVITFSDFHERQSVVQSLRRTADQLAPTKYSLIAGTEFAQAAIAHAIESGDSVEALILIAPKDASNGASPGLPLEQVNAPTLLLFGTRDQVVAP